MNLYKSFTKGNVELVFSIFHFISGNQRWFCRFHDEVTDTFYSSYSNTKFEAYRRAKLKHDYCTNEEYQKIYEPFVNPLLDDEELKRLIWEEWESEIKEGDPRQIVFKYMKLMRDSIIL